MASLRIVSSEIWWLFIHVAWKNFQNLSWQKPGRVAPVKSVPHSILTFLGGKILVILPFWIGLVILLDDIFPLNIFP